MAGGCHRSGRRVSSRVRRLRAPLARLKGFTDKAPFPSGKAQSLPGRRHSRDDSLWCTSFLSWHFLRERSTPSGEGVFPPGRKPLPYRSRLSGAGTCTPSWRGAVPGKMECAPMPPGEAHAEKPARRSPFHAGSGRPGVRVPWAFPAGPRQLHPGRSALFRIRRFSFLSGKFPFPVGRDGCTLSGLDVLRLFAEEMRP